jgi:hypothetical protein
MALARWTDEATETDCDYGVPRDCRHGNDPLECPACMADQLEAVGYTLDGRACEYDREPEDYDGPFFGLCLYCQRTCGHDTDVCDQCLDALIASEPPNACPVCGSPGAYDQPCLNCDGAIYDRVVAYETERYQY